MKPQRIEITKTLDANPVSEAERFIAPFRAGVDSLRMPRIGQSAVFMKAGRPESRLSNWVADALVAQARELGYKPDLGVCNMGGLRSAMPEGIVRRGDILAISPFNNYLTILTLTGEDLLALCRDIAAVYGEGVSSAMRMIITPDGKLNGIQLSGQDIDPQATYTIATLDYLADGNDKLYSFKRSKTRIVTKHLVSDVLMRQLQQLDAKGEKATSEIEGRITVLTTNNE